MNPAPIVEIKPMSMFTLYPERCPVKVLMVDAPTRTALIAMPSGDQFTVPLKSLGALDE